MFSARSFPGCFGVGLILVACLLIPLCISAQTPQAGTVQSASLPPDVQAKLDKLEADLKAAQDKGDTMAEAMQLNLIGNLVFMHGDKQRALDSFNQALPIFHAAGNKMLEAFTLLGLGNTYSALGQPQKALDPFNQALPIFRTLGNSGGEGVALNGLGIAYSALGEPQKALDNFNQALPIYHAAGNRAGEAGVLALMGNAHFAIGEKQKALDEYNQVLSIYRATGNTNSEAVTLNFIGNTQSSMGEKQMALDNYNQALRIFRAKGNTISEAATLNFIGNTQSTMGEKQKALDDYNQALRIFRATADRKNEATTLNNIGVAYADMSDARKALDYENQALEISHSLGDSAGEANALRAAGSAYGKLGQPQKALDYFNRVLPMFRAAGNRKNEAATLNDIGSAYIDLGEMQKALDDCNQALSIARQVGDRYTEAAILNNIGSANKVLGEMQKALDYHNQALTILREIGDRLGEASTLGNIGSVYDSLGEKQKALDYFNQALPIQREIDDRGGEAKALSNIGKVYENLGEKEKALDYYNQALAIQREIGARDGEAKTLSNIGTIYDDLAEKQRALDYYNQALQINREIGARDGEATTLNNIGFVYSVGEGQKALNYYNQALAIRREVGNRGGEATTLNNIGFVYSNLGDKQKALDYYNQALTIQIEVGDRGSEASTLNNLAGVYTHLGEMQKALDYYNRALPLATALRDPLLEAIVLGNLELNQRSDHPAEAIFFGKQAVNFLQQVRGNIQGLDKQLQSGFLASKTRYYQILADLLITQNRLPEAQQVLDLLKQQEYSDYVRGEATDTMSPLTLTPAERQAEEEYQKDTAQLVSIGEKWAKLSKNPARSPGDEQQFDDLSKQLSKATAGLDAFYSRLYVLFGKSNIANDHVDDVQGNVSSLKQIIGKMPHTVALYTLVGTDRTSIIVITGSAKVPAVVRESAISEVELNRKIAAFQEVLRHPGQDPKPLAQEMYNLLIGPVKADLDQAKAETLVWSLDGSLRYVPIAALYDGKQYVVENYNSATISPVSIAHLAVPPDMSNITSVAMGISQKFEEGLPALPAVVAELDHVIKDAKVQGADGVLPGTILLNGQFTRKAMENQFGVDPTVVHIASHFVYKSGDAAKSYLLLAGNDKDSAPDHLTVEEFHTSAKLKLTDTALLTLSACDTGKSGSTDNGKEVDGLGMTAELNGARAVISSLWSVNDSSTGQLMGDFYKRWAASGGKITKVEALRQAQLDLLLSNARQQGDDSGRGFAGKQSASEKSSAGFTHPYYWAPFVLMGNWQ